MSQFLPYNFPAVTIRQTHERPEGMDEGTIIMCGLEAQRVIECIEVVIAQRESSQHVLKMVPDYNTEAVSKKILRIIKLYRLC